MSEKFNIPELNDEVGESGDDSETFSEIKKRITNKVFDLFHPDRAIGMTSVFKELQKNGDFEVTLGVFQNILREGLLSLWPRKDECP